MSDSPSSYAPFNAPFNVEALTTAANKLAESAIFILEAELAAGSGGEESFAQAIHKVLVELAQVGKLVDEAVRVEGGTVDHTAHLARLDGLNGSV